MRDLYGRLIVARDAKYHNKYYVTHKMYRFVIQTSDIKTEKKYMRD